MYLAPSFSQVYPNSLVYVKNTNISELGPHGIQNCQNQCQETFDRANAFQCCCVWANVSWTVGGDKGYKT